MRSTFCHSHRPNAGLNEELDTKVNELQIERNEERRTFCVVTLLLRFSPMCCPRRHNEGLDRWVSKPKALVLETEQRGKAVGQQRQSQRKVGVCLISPTKLIVGAQGITDKQMIAQRAR